MNTRRRKCVLILASFVLVYIAVTLPAFLNDRGASLGYFFALSSWGPASLFVLPHASLRALYLLALIPWAAYILLCAITDLGEVHVGVHMLLFMIWHGIGLILIAFTVLSV